MPLAGFDRLLAAALVAELAAITYLLVAWLGSALVQRFTLRTAFHQTTLGSAGRRFHGELVRRRAQFGVLASTLLVAALAAVAAWFLLPAALPFATPRWGRWALLVQEIASLAGFACIAWRVFLGQRAARRAWHANLAVGHLLQRFALLGHRVFHEASIAGLTVDHVVFGPRGVFLVNVVVRDKPRKLKDPSARFHAVERQLEAGGVREFEPVFSATRRVTETARWLESLVGRKLRPVSAIVLPGWDTEPTVDGDHLLFNLDNLASLLSWAKSEHGLLGEDIKAVHESLLELCRDPRPV
jgi:hypothetical protein